MARFCKNCNNLLKANIINQELIFKCERCGSTFPSSPDDSLRFEESKQSNLELYNLITKNMIYDSANPREMIECPKCKNIPSIYVRIGNKKKKIYACEKCEHSWE
jgi:DNA-directed RNA polymerase subunit M/transcription elongation factor TFIIS